MSENIYILLSLGFSLGLLHAFDADHVMAVSSMSLKHDNKQSIMKKTLGFCLKWALGHGGVLCLIALAALYFGASLPEWAVVGAEKLVGLILIAIGVWILKQCYDKKITLRIHEHDGHTHMHLADAKHSNRPWRDHSPMLVGITHGLAGSAPVLAVLPSLASEDALHSFFYIFVFSFGVLIAMSLFGLGLGLAQSRISKYSRTLYEFTRIFTASIAIAFGTYWLASS